MSRQDTPLTAIPLELDADAWRVTRNGETTYFTGTKRQLWREYGTFDTADRLDADGNGGCHWTRIYEVFA